MSDEFRDTGTPPLMITDDNGNVWKRVTGPGIDDGILFTFPIAPRAHARSRTKSGQILPYLPPELREHYVALRDSAIEQMPEDFEIFTETINLEIFLGKEWSQIRISPAEAPRMLRGDLDNYAKTICDALQGKQRGCDVPPPGSLWLDDKLISRLTVEEVDANMRDKIQEELL